ncbi:unnamed protein product [Linum tenue]|uniref:Uncharacterized protein n=1 Tax=Linum tenue TaxID=586396 RepID=A0AAV0KZJ1_9ROSI|nr:unnamed protein product [Linum tenue]
MSSTDELFLNGQIKPQVLTPLLDFNEEEEGDLELGNKKGFHRESNNEEERGLGYGFGGFNDVAGRVLFLLG